MSRNATHCLFWSQRFYPNGQKLFRNEECCSVSFGFFSFAINKIVDQMTSDATGLTTSVRFGRSNGHQLIMFGGPRQPL